MIDLQTSQLPSAPPPSTVPPCGCWRETREQLATPRHGALPGREPHSPQKQAGSGHQAWGLSGTGASMLRSEATLSGFHGAMDNSHVAAAVWPSPVHQHTHAHASPSSQWLGSFPTIRAKERQVNTYGGQKHTKPQPSANTHMAPHSHGLSSSDTHTHMVQTDQSSSDTRVQYLFPLADMPRLRQRLALSAFICADFLRHMHTQRAHAPKSTFSLHTQLCTLLPATSHSLE